MLAAVYTGFVGAMTLAIIGVWMWSGPMVGVFFAGLTVGALPTLWLGFYTGAGFSHRSMGPEAERWTAELLDKLDRRTWKVFHDLSLRHTNIDHVIVGPGRIYAVETKWTSMRPAGHVREHLGQQAQRRAQELSAALARQGCRRVVTPLLVIWGPHAVQVLGEVPRSLVATDELGPRDVRIVAGAASRSWLPKLAQAADRLEYDRPAELALEALLADEAA